jgi:translation elongation factor EF-Tu-like GTPase
MEHEAMSPGDAGGVEMTLLNPERFGDELRRGNRFEIREGARIVGWGIIDKVRKQESPPRSERPALHKTAN